jgi:hypothetical protein
MMRKGFIGVFGVLSDCANERSDRKISIPKTMNLIFNPIFERQKMMVLQIILHLICHQI